MKSLPNGVVKDVDCSLVAISTDYGFEYTLTFIKNPGELKELELNTYLDGSRPTVAVSARTYALTVYNKVNGEFTDYFPDRCEGVTVKVLADSANADNSWSGATARPGSLGYLYFENFITLYYVKNLSSFAILHSYVFPCLGFHHEKQ